MPWNLWMCYLTDNRESKLQKELRSTSWPYTTEIILDYWGGPRAVTKVIYVRKKKAGGSVSEMHVRLNHHLFWSQRKESWSRRTQTSCRSWKKQENRFYPKLQKGMPPCWKLDSGSFRSFWPPALSDSKFVFFRPLSLCTFVTTVIEN